MGDLDQLERLERLRATGGLTPAEFAKEKARILNPPSLGFGPSWRTMGIFLGVLVAIGAIGTAILFLMPEPERAGNSVASSSGAGPANVGVANTSAAIAPVGELGGDNQPLAQGVTEDNAAGDEGGYVEPKPVRGRCLLQVAGKKYIDGVCEIFRDPDRSLDIQDTLNKPTYFAKVMLDGTAARGYWNEEPGATRAHTDLGDLTRDGPCWINQATRICAWP
jgi:hypothetical protein